MLFNYVELMNCTLATANMQLKAYLNGRSSCFRLYELLLDSYSNDEKFSLTCAFDLYTQRSALADAFKQFKTHSLGFVKNA